jgi:hypothetical protein
MVMNNSHLMSNTNNNSLVLQRLHLVLTFVYTLPHQLLVAIAHSRSNQLNMPPTGIHHVPHKSHGFG